jgi:hypothetical protein
MFDPQLPGPDFVLAAGKARQSDVLEQAECDRLIRRIAPAIPGLSNRVLAGIGDLLIVAGTKLRGPELYQDNYQTANGQ